MGMTKTLLVLLLLLPCWISAADLTGEWNAHLLRFGETFAPARVNLKEDGTKLTGTLNELKLEGTVEGNHLQFTATRPNGKEWGQFQGEIQGDEITGTLKQQEEEFGWKARRVTLANTAPQTHRFEPTQFHRLFSGTIAPVLHIHPGDTIQTTTVDAGGRDAKGVRHSLGGNPETGPFFVEGAMPGDTLAIHFRRLRLNRNSAGKGLS